jgi:hypothetical protein
LDERRPARAAADLTALPASGGSLGGVDAVSSAQLAVCERFGLAPNPPKDGSKLGVSRDLRQGWPLNGLRHVPEGTTSGWYLWVGEQLSEPADFFVPLHVDHLADWRPEVLPYLALPPGWRFLLAPRQEDVWFDSALLSAS